MQEMIINMDHGDYNNNRNTSDKINRHSNDKIVRPFVQDCHNRQLGSRQIIHTHPVC